MSRDPRLLFNEAKLFCDNGLISMTCVQIWEDMKGAPVDQNVTLANHTLEFNKNG